MGLFKRKRKIIDLSESYDLQKRHPVRIQRKAEEIPKDYSSSQDNSNSGGFFGGFFGNTNSTTSTTSHIQNNSNNEQMNTSDSNLNNEEKRRRLAKRLQTMTEKLDEISNQIYHLQQRVEVVEKKLNINTY